MNWIPLRWDVLESTAGYRVTTCVSYGIPTGRYIAFLPRINGKPKVLRGFDSQEEAIEACEDHRQHE